VISPIFCASGACCDLSRGMRQPNLWILGLTSKKFCCAGERPALSPLLGDCRSLTFQMLDVEMQTGDVSPLHSYTEVCYGISSETLPHNH